MGERLSPYVSIACVIMAVSLFLCDLGGGVINNGMLGTGVYGLSRLPRGHIYANEQSGQILSSKQGVYGMHHQGIETDTFSNTATYIYKYM